MQIKKLSTTNFSLVVLLTNFVCVIVFAVDQQQMPPPRDPPHRPMQPPEYNEAARMLRTMRLNRAHSHEGVTNDYYHSYDDEGDDQK